MNKYYCDSYQDICLDGSNGIVHSICKDVGYYNPKVVKAVILKINEMLQAKEEYVSTRQTYTIERKIKIKEDSFEYHMLTYLKEGGCSYQTLTSIYNAMFRAKNDLPPIGSTAVYNSILRGNHVKIRTTKIPQTDLKNVIHQQAQYNWFSQLLVRMGVRLPEIEGSEYRKRLKDEWVDYEKLKAEDLTFDLEQVAFWDEIHICQLAGTNQDETLIFGRNSEGLYDPKAEIDDREDKNKRVS